jgi:hypothetical protein
VDSRDATILRIDRSHIEQAIPVCMGVVQTPPMQTGADRPVLTVAG